mmetsp:Transcript_7241/g.11480  ORF Transcript_7241/g.11480 Transcript_7241/m.11480 type:complete len:204 (-) Transcript_7241:19-630(-)
MGTLFNCKLFCNVWKSSLERKLLKSAPSTSKVVSAGASFLRTISRLVRIAGRSRRRAPHHTLMLRQESPRGVRQPSPITCTSSTTPVNKEAKSLLTIRTFTILCSDRTAFSPAVAIMLMNSVESDGVRASEGTSAEHVNLYLRAKSPASLCCFLPKDVRGQKEEEKLSRERNGAAKWRRGCIRDDETNRYAVCIALFFCCLLV